MKDKEKVTWNMVLWVIFAYLWLVPALSRVFTQDASFETMTLVSIYVGGSALVIYLSILFLRLAYIAGGKRHA